MTMATNVEKLGLPVETLDLLGELVEYDLTARWGQRWTIVETSSVSFLKKKEYPVSHLPKKPQGNLLGVTFPRKLKNKPVKLTEGLEALLKDWR
jgi:hypothetical protein